MRDVSSMDELADVEFNLLSHDWNAGLNVENLRLLQGFEFVSQLQHFLALFGLQNVLAEDLEAFADCIHPRVGLDVVI